MAVTKQAVLSARARSAPAAPAASDAPSASIASAIPATPAISPTPATSVISPELSPELAEARAQLFGAAHNVYFAAIRHHSPACALALRHMLREIKPAAVLVEGPDDLDHLLPLLRHEDTRAPVAWLCQSTRALPVSLDSEEGIGDSNSNAGNDDDNNDDHGISDRNNDDDGGNNDNSSSNNSNNSNNNINNRASASSGTQTRTETRSAFFPFCDYSPEWIALREGAAQGAQTALIDLPWRHKAWRQDGDDMSAESGANRDDDSARGLMEERYFLHSRYLSAMARRLGCVDHHELWDRFFELRAPESLADWRAFFADVFSWCAMARLDYEPEVLEAEGSLPRERHMADHVRRWCEQVDGPILVVTGGFHTLELLRQWQQAVALPKATVSKRTSAATAAAASSATATITPAPSSSVASAKQSDGAWLIRYSFERLDALNGYGAGMPAPGYYQQAWERFDAMYDDAHGTVRHDTVCHDTQNVKRNSARNVKQNASRDIAQCTPPRDNPYASVAIDCLIRFARQTREQDQADAVSTALVQAAAEQAMRLAALRGNAGPGRQDLLDAIRSCFIKGPIDEGQRGFTADLRRFLSGSRIGDVPPSAGSPSLVEDARRRAREAGVRLDDGTPRVARLDIYRKPAHQRRSRFFHAMAYLDVGLATWLAGPDFLSNSRLQLLFEEWRAAWSPIVEARLIDLAADGATVDAVCMAKLRREEDALASQGRARSAGAAVMLLLRACLIGLQAHLPQLLTMLSTHLNEDADLGSVIECGHRLATLWRAREPLGVQQHPALRELLVRVWPAALYLLPNLSQADESNEAQAVSQLMSLRELSRLLRAIDGHHDHDASGAPDISGTANTSNLSNISGSLAIDLEPFRAQLERFVADAAIEASPALRGAAAALLYLDGHWDESSLDRLLVQHFGAGAEPNRAVRFLKGFLSSAPELLLRLPTLLEGLDRLVQTWDADTFIAYLPDLRQAFTRLKPQETSALALRIARLHGDEGSAASLVRIHDETSEADLHQGVRLESALVACLRRDGLTGWLNPLESA